MGGHHAKGTDRRQRARLGTVQRILAAPVLDALPLFSPREAESAHRNLVDARLASCIEWTIGRALAQFTASVVEPSGHKVDLSKERMKGGGSTSVVLWKICTTRHWSWSWSSDPRGGTSARGATSDRTPNPLKSSHLDFGLRFP